MNGEKPRAKERHEFFVADRSGGRGNRVVVEGAKDEWSQEEMERQGELDRAVGIVGWKTGA